MYNDIGSDWFQTLQDMLNGNMGFFFGLLLAVAGLLTIALKKQFGAGVLMIFGGVLITLAPGVFNSMRSLVADILENVGGNESTSGFQTTPR